MSSNLNYKQVANVERRTWDLEEYERKAQARASSSSEKAGDKRPLSSIKHDDEKEEFRPAEKGAAGPQKSKRAFLKARRDKVVDIDSKVGSTEIVSAEAVATSKTNLDIKDGITKTGVGWHCKVCDCFLKDSHAYLDHINGKKHQRNLGYSMRVEKSTTSQVKERLAQLAKEREEANNKGKEEPTNFEEVVKAKDGEALKRKEERARKREERKKRIEQQEQKQQEEEEEEEDVEEEELHPDMAAMMGFAGFGGGNKTGWMICWGETSCELAPYVFECLAHRIL